MLSSESVSCSLAFKDVITIRPLLFGSTCVYTGEILFSHNQFQFLIVKCAKVLKDMVQKKLHRSRERVLFLRVEARELVV